MATRVITRQPNKLVRVTHKDRQGHSTTSFQAAGNASRPPTGDKQEIVRQPGNIDVALPVETLTEDAAGSTKSHTTARPTSIRHQLVTQPDKIIVPEQPPPIYLGSSSASDSDAPPGMAHVDVGGIQILARLMTTQISDSGEPDTLVAQCPVCANGIEGPIVAGEPLRLHCEACGLGRTGNVPESKVAPGSLTVLEPFSAGLMTPKDIGLKHPLLLDYASK